MINLHPGLDPQYNDWFFSFKQRVSRALTEAAGVKGTLCILGVPINAGIQVGITHNKPNFMIGLSIAPRFSRGYNVVGFETRCGVASVIFMNQVSTFGQDTCTDCKAEYQQATDAQKRLATRIFTMTGTHPPTEEVVVEEGKEDGPRKGALADWPN